MKTNLDLTLSGGFRAASEARRSLEGLDDAVPQEVLDDVRLLVNELVTNSIRHARVGTGSWIRLKVLSGGDRIRVEVTDPGSGFEYRPRTAASGPDSGWGLYLVDRIADDWGVDRAAESCSVWFELDCGTGRRQWVSRPPD